MSYNLIYLFMGRRCHLDSKILESMSFLVLCPKSKKLSFAYCCKIFYAFQETQISDQKQCEKCPHIYIPDCTFMKLLHLNQSLVSS